MFRFTTLTIFALAATFVAAQDTSTSADTPDPTGTTNSCVTDCIVTGALAAGCTSSTDYTCFCTSPAFQTPFEICIQQGCPDQLALAIAAQQAACAGVTPPIVSISSGAPSGTSSASASGTLTTSTPSTSAPSTSAPSTSHPSTTASPSSGTGNPTSSPASSSRSGAAFQNPPVAGAMGVLAAFVGAAIF